MKLSQVFEPAPKLAPFSGHLINRHSPYPVGEEALRAEIDRLRDDVFRLNQQRLKVFEKAYNKRRYALKKVA